MTKKASLNQDEIGMRLKLVREALKLSTEQMYRKTGFFGNLISEMENGLKEPSSTYLFILADRFQVNLNYIMSGRGKMFQNDELGLEDFGKDAVMVTRMLFYMKKVDLVKFAMLKRFLECKTYLMDWS
jgi:transcriptional regulator with XRE-family HTH domain